jgi:D-amino-acid dehydrogenase
MPMAPVYGYSISAPLREALNAPRSALMDERYKVAITRLGQRVRVAGSAELGGRLQRRSPAALQTLYKVLHDWFPGAAQLSNTGAAVQEWKGARPMLPDGPPVLGASGIPGVWLNLGHGSSGWALACGSARVVADLMSGHDPLLDIEGLGIERLTG